MRALSAGLGFHYGGIDRNWHGPAQDREVWYLLPPGEDEDGLT
jgi:hypothetical protein